MASLVLNRGKARIDWTAWSSCAALVEVEPRTRVVLGFDGSASGDSTALVGCTVGPGFEFGDFAFLSDVPEDEAVVRSRFEHAHP